MHHESQTLRRRLPPTTVSGGLFNAKHFRSPVYIAYTAFGVVAFLGLFTGSVHSLWEKSSSTSDVRPCMQCSLSSTQVRLHKAFRKASPSTWSLQPTQEMPSAA